MALRHGDVARIIAAELDEVRRLSAGLRDRDRGKYRVLRVPCARCGRLPEWAELLSSGRIRHVDDDVDLSTLLDAGHDAACVCGEAFPEAAPLRRAASEIGEARRLVFDQAAIGLARPLGLTEHDALKIVRFVLRYEFMAHVPTDAAPPATVIATLHGVSKRYTMGDHVVQALRDVTLTLHGGEFAALVGASGSGKSTLLNILGCIDRPTSGVVEIAGQRVADLSDDERADVRNRSIGFVFQSFNLMPALNVLQNVELPLLARRESSARERSAAVSRIVDEVGLSRFARHRPDQLSGGQRQRVAVARALVTDPSLVIADEPTANLDSESAHRVLNLMVEMNELRGVTFLISTHDERVLGRFGRKIRISDGALVMP